MKNIVKIENSNLVVTLEDVVKFSGNKYESIRRLLIDNKEKFEILGVDYKTKRNINVDFKSMKLNEEQTTFLFVLMRNTPQIIEFKFNLVTQFMALKDMVCETNKKQIQTANDRLKIVQQNLKDEQNRKHKIYKSGFVALRSYLKRENIKLSEDDAWSILKEKGIIDNKDIPVMKRILIKSEYGRQQSALLGIEFDPNELDLIFKPMCEIEPSLLDFL